MDDLLEVLLYVVIGLVGIIASAYKNKKKAQPVVSSQRPQMSREITAEPEHDFGPDLGPLMEIFDIPRQRQEKPMYESVEEGPSVEEGGWDVDTGKASAELAGLSMEYEGRSNEEQGRAVEAVPEEGQSDIQKMIAKYNAISKELGEDGFGEEISATEIVSVEAEEEARLKLPPKERIFDLRKAIIYSEILKRKEY
ncbi:MAG TPA: hypothetical protein VJ203_13805 [Bacteroidales bacterium]|nr:hypothetical protein [Bacteroidales bacterium]